MDRRIGVGSLMFAATMAGAATASAQDASPAAGPWTVIAQGLDAPRGITVSQDGTLWVGEQGTGGDACIEVPGGGTGCIGATGSISSVKDGVLTAFVAGLPSMASGEEIGGVSDFALSLEDGGAIYVINLGGGPGMRAGFPDAYAANLGTLSTGSYVDQEGGINQIADLAQWEADNDPDAADPGSSIDSNPYGVAAAPDGGYYVVDAGGNDLLKVGQDEHVTLVAVFPAEMQSVPQDPSASADPAASPAMMPMQAVPTAVTVGPDGAAYVTQLTGAPFPPGGAKVWRVVEGEAPTVYATGLTNAMDLAFGPDGTLWVVEFSHNGLLSGDPAGGLMQVPPGGGVATLVTSEGLVAPGGVAVDKDGAVYVTNGSVMAGGGSILRLDR